MSLASDIAAALTSIGSVVPEVAHTMRHGDEVGQVVQSSSTTLGGDFGGEKPTEATRVIAPVASFPTLDDGESIELDDSLRLVVSLTTDAIGATWKVGLSAPFEACRASVDGKRRVGNAVKIVRSSLSVLAVPNGPSPQIANACSPFDAESWSICIRQSDWPFETAPERSDAMTIAYKDATIKLKVSAVTKSVGYYIIKCRTGGL